MLTHTDAHLGLYEAPLATALMQHGYESFGSAQNKVSVWFHSSLSKVFQARYNIITRFGTEIQQEKTSPYT